MGYGLISWGVNLGICTEVCMLVGTNLRREFAHARNLIKSVCMRGFSSQICATQPANLCMCAWTDKECSSPVTRVRQILNLSAKEWTKIVCCYEILPSVWSCCLIFITLTILAYKSAFVHSAAHTCQCPHIIIIKNTWDEN